MCKGPKSKNCSVWSYRLVNETYLTFESNITESVPSLKVKIIMSSNDKVMFRLQTNKMCEHLYLRPLLESFFNVTRECIIQKGRYFFAADIEKIAQNYYGGSFIYGNLTFKSVFNNNVCNLSCAIIHVNLYPKKL
ncbi:uncharacterized protein LOC116412646 [Galleria mellonella]|uniref:Uncharacterized protein LOC116412646 n=1 Tax=Galleria mellonella TaxID=7137 RepID=A0A6J3BQX9_GALME|nr:uncharacterized protein LOC116412646 [Galleria mellonella]